MIRILHVYPELLNLYGEYANLTILSRYLREEGAEVEVTKISLGESIPDGYDMLYFGCGTENASLGALKGLLPFRDKIKEYYDNGALILATGNSFDLFGRTIADDRDGTFEGLALFDYTVNRTHKKRFLGDAVLTSELFPQRVIGFVNKCSTVTGVETPLFRAVMGLGNDNEMIEEGLVSNNFFGTSLIGPLLVRNPAICRYLMDLLYQKTGHVKIGEADFTLQETAYDVALRELSARIK